MPRAPLLPQVANGMRQMPPDEAFVTALKLTASLVAGVSFLGFHLDQAHPLNRCAAEMAEWVSPRTAWPDAADVTLEHIIALLERIGFQLWSLAHFQNSPEVKARLVELIGPVCQMPDAMLAAADPPTAGRD